MNHWQKTLFQQLQKQMGCLEGVDNEVLFFEFSPDMLSALGHRTFLSGAFFIGFVENGTLPLSVNYQTQTVSRGNMIFLTPRMVVALGEMSPDGHGLGLALAPDFFDSLPTNPHVYNQWAAYQREYAFPTLALGERSWENMLQTLRLFPGIETARLHRNGMYRYLTNFLLLQMAEALHEKGALKSGKIAHTVELYQKFRRLLAVHYKQEHNIAFYADKLCISPTYLSRIVRQVTHNTVNAHVARMLLIEARYLLDCTDWTVKQIAEELHFADQASFGKFFKEQMKLSPTAYRQKIGC